MLAFSAQPARRCRLVNPACQGRTPHKPPHSVGRSLTDEFLAHSHECHLPAGLELIKCTASFYHSKCTCTRYPHYPMNSCAKKRNESSCKISGNPSITSWTPAA